MNISYFALILCMQPLFLNIPANLCMPHVEHAGNKIRRRKKEKVEREKSASECCVVVLTVCSVNDTVWFLYMQNQWVIGFFWFFIHFFLSNESQQAFQSWCELLGSDSSLRHLYIVNFVTNTCSYCCRRSRVCGKNVFWGIL